MNIKEAKMEISNTLRVYHEKDENGDYCYPLVRQRPILLMGPPGIGKTAIMEQIARENQVGLVAYTITHHTRQSAVGLPRIQEKTYENQKVSVTEYTMSEIIDSVYACMERTGKREGILFIDEINCASETLAPTMLQFLQNKTFGSHRVPEGWMIVAAGNPPQYNKSVHEFDIVTLDRVRVIDVDIDLPIWLEYAADVRIHGAILSYLSLKKDRFYLIEQKADKKRFVTARGWEDLSELLKSYERLGIEVSEKQIQQFLQKEETAVDFADYYHLYQKYGQDYSVQQILNDCIGESERQTRIELAKKGSFEERFIVTELVLAYLQGTFSDWKKEDERFRRLYQELLHYKERIAKETFVEFVDRFGEVLKVKQENNLLSAPEIACEKWVFRCLQTYRLNLKEVHIQDGQESFRLIKNLFQEERNRQKNKKQIQKERLDRAFAFIESCFGNEQEMILFVTRLTSDDAIVKFIGEQGCDAFFGHCDLLLYQKKKDELLKACLQEERINVD